MYYKKSIITIIICFFAAILFNTNLYAAENEQLYKQMPVSRFRVSETSPNIETQLDYVDWWYSEWDDCRYLFLPSTADRTGLVITYTADGPLYLNGKAVTSGENTAIISESDEFDIKVGTTNCGKLKIMQSNLGCIYLKTPNGGLYKIDANRNYVETGNALMLNDKGKVEYDGELEKITSHGNISWTSAKKKPYNFKLPKKADLYGMGKAKKWMLISNYLDHSMMHNYFTMKISRMLGMEYVIDSTFVDLYTDGSYRGTYQLCERIQIQKSRLNIRDLEEDTEKLNDKDLEDYPQTAVGADGVKDCRVNCYKYFDIPNEPEDITGGYLLQFQLWERYAEKSDSAFVTSRGQVVQIDGPEYASKNQVLYIRQFMQELEDAIYSDTGYNSLGKHYSEYMDVDSFAKTYLLEEFAMDIDAGRTSFYMWKDSDLTGDGKLHFSPVWDFDLSYGTYGKWARNSDGNSGWSCGTNNIFAAYFPIDNYKDTNTVESGLPTTGVNWLGAMFRKDVYKKRAGKMWEESFKPLLEELVLGDDPGLVQMAEKIQPSAEMSNARWHTYGGKQYCVYGDQSGKDFMDTVGILRNFTEKRLKYLNEYFEPYARAYDEENSTFIYGDVDCDKQITASDSAFILQKTLLDSFELPIQKETDNWLKFTDVDCDNVVTATDALLVMQKTLSPSFEISAEKE